MTLGTAFFAGFALPELEPGVSAFSSLLGAFSEGLVFVGGAILVLCLVLEAIREVTWSVAFWQTPGLKLKKCNRLTDLSYSCADVAWKFWWMLDVNVDMKQYHPIVVVS